MYYVDKLSIILYKPQRPVLDYRHQKFARKNDIELGALVMKRISCCQKILFSSPKANFFYFVVVIIRTLVRSGIVKFGKFSAKGWGAEPGRPPPKSSPVILNEREIGCPMRSCITTNHHTVTLFSPMIQIFLSFSING